MQSCSKELRVMISNPKMSKMPMKDAARRPDDMLEWHALILRTSHCIM